LPISSLPAKNRTFIKYNTKKEWKNQYYVRDFLENWKNTFESLSDRCRVDVSECPNLNGLNGTSCAFSTNSPTPQADKNKQESLLKAAAVLSVLALAGYIFAKDIKKMVKF
jgi:hypothetical protein